MGGSSYTLCEDVYVDPKLKNSKCSLSLGVWSCRVSQFQYIMVFSALLGTRPGESRVKLQKHVGNYKGFVRKMIYKWWVNSTSILVCKKIGIFAGQDVDRVFMSTVSSRSVGPGPVSVVVLANRFWFSARWSLRVPFAEFHLKIVMFSQRHTMWGPQSIAFSWCT